MTHEEHAKHFSWCLKHGLKIYPMPESTNTYYIIVVAKLINGRWKPTPGSIRYAKKPKGKEEKWWEKIEELHEHYYKIGTKKIEENAKPKS